MEALLPYAATAAGAIILIFYAALVRRSRTSPPLPPGPIGLPILEPQLLSFFAILASTHGPLYSLRLGSKLAFVISSPSLAREVLRDHDANFANRDVPAAARVIAYGGSDIVWNPNGPTWRMLRRICVREMLSPVSLDAVYHFRRRELRAAVRHLYTVAAEQKPVNVGAEMFLAVLNVITSMLWGGTVEGAEDRSAVGKEFRELVGDITELLGLPNVSDGEVRSAGNTEEDEVLLQRFDGLFARIIAAKEMRTVTCMLSEIVTS